MDRKLWHLLNGFGFGFSSAFFFPLFHPTWLISFYYRIKKRPAA